MQKINLGIIGCGRIGKMHVNNILGGFPNVHVKAIASEYPDKEWAAERGIPISEDLDLVLKDETIEAVLIAAPSAAHVDLVKKAAQAKKHIFCEKPIAFTLARIQEAIDAVKENKVKFQIGYNRRFDPDFARVKEIATSGALGDLYLVKITNRDPKRPDINFIPGSGGLFMDFNVHDFDTARFVTGQEIEEVYASGAALIDSKIAELGDIDTTIITLKMSKGTLCVIDASREAVYGYDQRVEVLGAKGDIKANNLTETNTFLATEKGVLSDKLLYSFVERYKQAYQLELKAFFNYLDAAPDAKSPASGLDTMRAVAAALAAKKSYAKKRAVRLEEVLV